MNLDLPTRNDLQRTMNFNERAMSDEQRPMRCA